MKDLFKPTENDFDEITTLWEESVRATHTFLSEDDISFFKPLIRNCYLKEVDLVGMKNTDDKIIAFMGVNGSHLEMLFIHPDLRGSGIGKFLITHAIHKFNVNTVDVNEQNEQAVGFYVHMGFEVISRDEQDGTGKPFPILHLKLKE